MSKFLIFINLIQTMAKKFLTIQESADLSKKSIQTIRRALKSKKIKYRKTKTPQGFNYLVSRDSLCEVYKIAEVSVKGVSKIKKQIKEKRISVGKKNINISENEFAHLTSTLDRIVSQHSEERQNFLRLVESLQEKIFTLENQLNLLKAPAKKWYQLWR